MSGKRDKKAFTLVEVMIVVLMSAFLLALIVTMTVTLQDRFDDAAKTVTQTNASIRYLNQIHMHARGCDEANIVPFDGSTTSQYDNGDVFFKKGGAITKVSVADYDIGADVSVTISNSRRVITVRIGDENYEIPY